MTGKRISGIVFRMALFLGLLAGICLAAGCKASDSLPAQPSQEDLIVVGFSQVGAESDWRNANTISMQEALSPQNGYRLILEDAQQKQEKQITSIRNFINQGVDYIVLAPTTETGWDTVLTEARNAQIPVIIVDRMIETEDTSLFTCWVGSDFLKEGTTAVQWMEENLREEPLKIVHLQGNLGSSAQLGRTRGLEQGLQKHTDWEVVFRAPGDFTQAKGQELMETVLEEGLEFNVIYSENDNMTYGAIEALQSAGIEPGKDVTIISFDASSTALHMLLEGKITYDVECNPLHGPRVQAIIEELEAQKPFSKYTYVEETSFDRSNTTEQLIESRGY
ncbi:MAG: ABC transporter substrate-binding protein [Parasporobacterium sp.]|nr:ABC transporter substrate-binding protein [Parasporobacterium sp.]